MLEIEKIAENLFDKIRSRFENISIGDEKAKATLDPEKARFFNFDYEIEGQNYGNITLSLIDDNSLKVYFDKEIDSDMDESVRKNWYQFLKNLRLFAKRNMLSFDIRDIAKSGLNIRDLKHINKDAEVQDVQDVTVTESKLYGTSRSSYQKLENVRIIARHSKPIVDENKPGARSRNIGCFYVENSLGERFRLPEGTTLNGARAHARHIKNGGSLHDDFGQHISKIVSEMNALRTFARNMRGRQFEDIETTNMVEAAVDHYGRLHRDLFTLRSQRGYEQYKSLWQPEAVTEEDFDLEALRERFVRKVFDDRLMTALPIVKRVYDQSRNRTAEEFEAWANGVLEDAAGINVNSPIGSAMHMKDSDGNVIDGDAEDDTLAELFNGNGFEWRFQDGVYYFESKEEVSRAKDIIAAHNPNMKFPKFGVFDYGYGVYGSTTFDREIGGYDAGVKESEDSDLKSIKLLSGIKIDSSTI